MSRIWLRPSILDSISQEIDATALPRYLFDIEINAHDDLLRITYKENRNLFFRLAISAARRGDNRIFCTVESPGEFTLNPETIYAEDLHSSRQRIVPWANRIVADIRATAKLPESDIDFVARWLEQLKRDVPAMPFLFSFEEKINSIDKLNRLERRFDNLLRERNAAGEHVMLLREQFELIRSAIDFVDKQTWVLIVGSRLMNIYRDVKQIRGEIEEIISREVDIRSLVAPDTVEAAPAERAAGEPAPEPAPEPAREPTGEPAAEPPAEPARECVEEAAGAG